MTNEEFQGLKAGDKVVIIRELRIGSNILPEGTEVIVDSTSFSYPEGVLVFGTIPSINRIVRLDIKDVNIVNKKDSSIRIISLEDVVHSIAEDKDIASTIYVAVPIDIVTSSSLLTLMTKDSVFVEIRN